MKEKFPITIAFRLPNKCETFLHPNITQIARQIIDDNIEQNPTCQLQRAYLRVNTTDTTSKAFSIKISERQYKWLRRYGNNDDRTVGQVVRLLILIEYKDVVRIIYGKAHATQDLKKMYKEASFR